MVALRKIFAWFTELLLEEKHYCPFKLPNLLFRIGLDCKKFSLNKIERKVTKVKL